MSLVDTLLTAAYEDTQLLIKNDTLGDVFSKTRDVDFLLRSPDEKKAETVCSFVNDNQYGKAKVERYDTGLSEFLCKRGLGYACGMRSSN